MTSLFDFDTAFEKNLVDYRNDVKPRIIRISSKIKFENKLKREGVEKLITELPSRGESLHIVSNGSFDYFTIIPQIINLSGNAVDEFYFTTWTMSRENVTQIIDLYDRGVFKKVTALTGEYFRTRESKVWSLLSDSLEARKQRVFSSKNHSKVTLLKIGGEHYIIEGSANFTANPRIEQFILSNSEELFNFHKEWLEEILQKNKVGYGI